MMTKFQKFFNGRYGLDKLSFVLLIISTVLVNIDHTWAIGLLVFGYTIFRIMSKNYSKRYKELQSFEKFISKSSRRLSPVLFKIRQNFNIVYRRILSWKNRISQRKYYSFTRCHNCKNVLRLPKNKGKLIVKCPVCKTEFIKKT